LYNIVENSLAKGAIHIDAQIEVQEIIKKCMSLLFMIKLKKYVK